MTPGVCSTSVVDARRALEFLLPAMQIDRNLIDHIS